MSGVEPAVAAGDGTPSSGGVLSSEAKAALLAAASDGNNPAPKATLTSAGVATFASWSGESGDMVAV